MPFKYEVNGQMVEFDKEPTPEDIDFVANKSGFSKATFPETPTQEQQLSPLDTWERFKYSFGNETGRKAYLTEKFPGKKITKLKSGKLAVDGIPIDPEGFSIKDLPGDIVDVSDELVRLGGQILGAVKGTPITPIAGTIAGGALGRAAGQTGVEVIGRAFGMQQEEVGQLAKDIAVEGVIGAASEGVGVGLRALSKPTAKFLHNFARKLTKKIGRPVEQKVLNFTGGMEQRNIKHLQIRGATNILTKENLSDDALLNIGKRIQQTAIQARSKLGQAVATGKGVIREMNKANINVTDIRFAFGTELQKVGLLKRNFLPMKQELVKLNAGQKTLLNIWNNVKGKQKISPAQALRWRVELDKVIKFDPTGKMTVSNAENALIQGVRGQLKQKLINVSDEFAQANADFSTFAKIEEALGPKLNLQSVENFLKTIFKGPQYFEDNLIKLNRYAGAEKTFLPKLRDVIAARDFASTTFRGIRTGIISGILGQTLGGAGGILPAASLGIMASTPRVAGAAIAGRQALSRLMGRGIEAGGKGTLNIAPKLLATLLSRAKTPVGTGVEE